MYDDLLDLFGPFMGNEKDRRAQIVRAFGTNNPIEGQLNFDLITDTFILHLIQVLEQRFEEIEPGKSALDLLKESIEKQRKIEIPSAPTLPPLPPPSPNPRMKDHLFFSYAHADRAFVERLAQDLRERGHVVWIDIEGIRGGDVWRQAISDGVSASAVVLLALSPDSVHSEWVEVEIRAARDYGKKIIPLLVRPFKDESDRAAYDRLGLEAIQYIDFGQGFDQGMKLLLLPDVLPKPQSGVPGHCQKLIAQLAARPWGLDHYIQSPAKLLPIDASPYEDGAVKGAPERLLERLWKGERLLILGEPGMGKTVALERLAWELASNDPLILPIFVALRDYDGGFLLDWIRLTLIAVGEIQPEAVEDIKRFLREIPFQTYFLLDGLNEVPPTHREKLLGEIKRLSMEFPRARLVVTSRVQDESWRSLRQSDAVRETYLIQPISPDQAQRYLAAHLNAVDCEALWNRLDDKMKGLAGTPLLLWLIKEAWLESHNIPGNRGALYGNFVARMLRRDDERKIGTGVPEKIRLDALERLALKMHEAQVIALSAEQVEVIIPDAAVLSALRVNGLLTGEKIIRFAPHQTVQEHFAARAIRAEVAQKVRSGPIGRMLTGRGVLNYAREPWWAETFIQLAGLTEDPNGLGRAVAEVNPWLAWWCVQDGKTVDKETERVIESKSIALVHSERVIDRRTAAQALAKLNSERVIAPLAPLCVDVDEGVCQTALTTLLAFGEAGQQAFKWAFRTEFSKRSPPQRAEWGRAVARIDPRPGVLDFNWGEDYWCPVPKGEFQMGSDQDSDNPKRIEKLDYDFWIARYPITYAQFQLFLNAPDGYRNPKWWKGLHEDGIQQQQKGAQEQRFKFWNHPRENVSWYDAVAFCQWLNALTPHLPSPNKAVGRGHRAAVAGGEGYLIRLPLETEWEKAASWDAKTKKTREYPWGDGYQAGFANISETFNKVGPHYLKTTTAVGIYPQGTSPCGALDMSGNVWEWCLNEDENGQVNIGSIEWRGLRGGSWDNPASRARVASRNNANPSRRDDLRGFRVVWAPVSLGVSSDH
ncbi:MAG: SUMF1/EgtB/PvdO family nonheme iron enzyme [Anaerolineae bacterium]|nr:SUMF1/EgtB/PvdO family nonheme iron enzyme [Anaerolineae bacterium]